VGTLVDRKIHKRCLRSFTVLTKVLSVLKPEPIAGKPAPARASQIKSVSILAGWIISQKGSSPGNNNIQDSIPEAEEYQALLKPTE
jgi:hypothetical protein